ncbi:unnamed protein product [Penicillium salamii]|uniref:C2H2-type domain-containing protein n=1 Tax=Penicillium salamii TaxID=1612424 RepID=A0A9W4JFF4_9EURO|nr:unnamed protein product [Penicillium salamii]CAG8385649.1 unnamed protein product [Penicillium salamii]CAG8395680.1 unnamed protein product [Penicillium salamii]CAG8415571.1 unnamed protein product [Penicillium salamii]
MDNGFDWLQGFLQPGSQAEDDPNRDDMMAQAHQAFRDVEEMANATFMNSQPRDEHPRNQLRQASALQQPPSTTRTSFGSSQPQPDYPQGTQDLDLPDLLREYLNNPQSHSLNPLMTPNNPPHGAMKHAWTTVNRGNLNQNASVPTQGSPKAARNPPSTHGTTRPMAPVHRATNTPARRDQSRSGTSQQRFRTVPGHHVQSGGNAQRHYADPYGEIQRRIQVQAMHPDQPLILPEIPEIDFQTAARAMMGVPRSAPPPQETDSPARRAQNTPHGHPTMAVNEGSRSSSSAARQKNQPVPRVQNTQKTVPRAQGFYQYPYPAEALAPVAPGYPHLSNPTTASTKATQKSYVPRVQNNPTPTRSTQPNQGYAQQPGPMMSQGTRIIANSEPTTAHNTPSANMRAMNRTPLDHSGSNTSATASTTTSAVHNDPYRGQLVRGNNHGKVSPVSIVGPPAQNHTNQQPRNPGQNRAAPAMVSSASVPIVRNAPTAGTSPLPKPSEPAHTRGSDVSLLASRVAQPRAETNPTLGTYQSHSHPPPGLQMPWNRSAKFQRLINGTRKPVASQNRPPRQLPPTSASWQYSPTPGEYAQQHHSGKILKNRDDLMQHISASPAITETPFDPITVARDILIAAGRHPKEKPLNNHLTQLRRNFVKLDPRIDLHTFRWDLVDAKQHRAVDYFALAAHGRPGPGLSPAQSPAHSPAPIPTTGSMPIPTSERPPASDPGPDQGPPSDLVVVQHQVATPAPPSAQSVTVSRDTPPMFPPKSSGIDARPPPNGLSTWGTLPFEPPAYQTSERVSPALASSTRPESPVPKQSDPPTHSTPIVSISPPSQNESQKTHPPTNPPPENARSIPNPISDVKSKTISQPPKATTRSPSKQVSKTPETTRLPTPQVVIPPSPDKMVEKKKPRRPPKSATNGVEARVPSSKPHVNYQVFACQWESCVAELHNLDALRGHLVKIHVPHHLVCKWKGCENSTPMAAADMYAHVSNEHISKIAWKLGDGPVVPEPAELTLDQPSYPAEPNAPKATMILPVDATQIQAYSKVYGLNSEVEKAKAVIDAGRHWKQQIGPALDQDGCRLSTPPRQTKLNCEEVAFISHH